MRMEIRRFARLTNAFREEIGSHGYHVAPGSIQDNFHGIRDDLVSRPGMPEYQDTFRPSGEML
jgi:hypothetical protein